MLASWCVFWLRPAVDAVIALLIERAGFRGLSSCLSRDFCLLELIASNFALLAFACESVMHCQLLSCRWRVLLRHAKHDHVLPNDSISLFLLLCCSAANDCDVQAVDVPIYSPTWKIASATSWRHPVSSPCLIAAHRNISNLNSFGASRCGLFRDGFCVATRPSNAFVNFFLWLAHFVLSLLSRLCRNLALVAHSRYGLAFACAGCAKMIALNKKKQMRTIVSRPTA